MKMTQALAIAVLACVMTAAKAEKPKANPADYPLTGTVTCSFSRTYNGQLLVRVGVLLNGEVLEMSTSNALVPMALGSYRLKLIKDKKEKPYEVDRQYEMLMPDGTTRIYTVTGVGASICAAAGSA
jgi:hypothetical protein